jgi:hypothetical protein
MRPRRELAKTIVNELGKASVNLIEMINGVIWESPVKFPHGIIESTIMREPSTGNVASLSRCMSTSRAAEPFVVVRVVNSPRFNLPRIPRECRITSVHNTVHLIAAVDLEDTRPALRAWTGLRLNRLCRFHGLLITDVPRLLIDSEHFHTIWTGVLLACPTFVGGREESAAIYIWTFHNELALYRCTPSASCAPTIDPAIIISSFILIG